MVYIYIHTHTHTHINVHIHTHTYKHTQWNEKNEILPLATTWMDLESIMLSEISQAKRGKYSMLSLICGI